MWCTVLGGRWTPRRRDLGCCVLDRPPSPWPAAHNAGRKKDAPPVSAAFTDLALWANKSLTPHIYRFIEVRKQRRRREARDASQSLRLAGRPLQSHCSQCCGGPELAGCRHPEAWELAHRWLRIRMPAFPAHPCMQEVFGQQPDEEENEDGNEDGGGGCVWRRCRVGRWAEIPPACIDSA